jgi:hypothetical protein
MRLVTAAQTLSFQMLERDRLEWITFYRQELRQLFPFDELILPTSQAQAELAEACATIIIPENGFVYWPPSKVAGLPELALPAKSL